MNRLITVVVCCASLPSGAVRITHLSAQEEDFGVAARVVRAPAAAPAAPTLQHATTRPRRHAFVNVLRCSDFQGKEACGEKGCVWDDGSRSCTLGWDVIAAEGPRFTDISQGRLGTCYLLAAVAAIAHAHPGVIDRMFVRRDLWQGPNPVYTTEWLLNGKPMRVAVDDQVPATRSGDLFFASPSSSWDFWPVLVEKSWAKIYGDFEAIGEGGYSGGEIFKAITQAPVDIKFHKGHISHEDLWLWLTWAARNNYPMVSTSSSADHGLLYGHAWAVLDATVMQIDGRDERVVQLYDPYGHNTYKGRIPNPNSNQGHFYAALDEYVSTFHHTAIARIREGYVISYLSVPIGHHSHTGGSGSPSWSFEFQFPMPDDQPFAVQLEWPSARLGRFSGECIELNPEASMQVHRLGEAVKVKVQNDDGYRKSAKMSNLRVDMPGPPGGFGGFYRAKVDAKFPRGAWLQEVVVNVYARAKVQLTLLDISTTRTETQLRKDADGKPYAEEEFAKFYGEGYMREWMKAAPRVVGLSPEPCAALAKRLGQLDNGKDIRLRGHDLLFPANLSSIAASGAQFWDESQGIYKPYTDFDTWKRIPEIMGRQFPPAKSS